MSQSPEALNPYHNNQFSAERFSSMNQMGYSPAQIKLEPVRMTQNTASAFEVMEKSKSRSPAKTFKKSVSRSPVKKSEVSPVKK